MKKPLTENEIKRNARRKKIIKRRLFIILISFIIAAVAVLCVLVKTTFFPVKKIVVEGSEIYSDEEIIKASGIGNKTALFSISESKVESLIISKLPYVESVKIKKKLPGTVRLTVTDAKEYFAFKTDNGYIITNKSTRILEKRAEVPENVITVNVGKAEYKKGENVVFGGSGQKGIFDLITSYTEEKGIKLDSVDLTDIVHIKIHIEGRFEVNLGTRENLAKKIDHLAETVKGIGDRKGRINLEMWSENDKKCFFSEEK